MKEETENQVSGRYNLRRRKTQTEEPLEQKSAAPISSAATPQQASQAADLEFGGRIGKRPVVVLFRLFRLLVWVARIHGEEFLPDGWQHGDQIKCLSKVLDRLIQ